MEENKLVFTRVSSVDEIDEGFDFIQDGVQSLFSESVGATVCKKCHSILTAKESIPSFQQSYLRNNTLRRLFTLTNLSHDTALPERSAYSDPQYQESFPKMIHEGCGGELEWIYSDPQYIRKLSSIFDDPNNVVLILARNQLDQSFAGMALSYLAPIQVIYENDFSYHFSGIGLDRIEKKMVQKFGSLPEKFIHIHTLGLLPLYRTAENIYLLIKYLFSSLPSGGFSGVCEVHRRNMVKKILEAGVSGIELFRPNTEEDSLKGPKYKNYDPTIFVVPDFRDRMLRILGSQELFYSSF